MGKIQGGDIVEMKGDEMTRYAHYCGKCGVGWSKQNWILGRFSAGLSEILVFHGRRNKIKKN